MPIVATEGMAMNGFPTRAPIELEDRPRQQQWLIDGLLGAPGRRHRRRRAEVRQSFLALDFAVAVAVGVPWEGFEAEELAGPLDESRRGFGLVGMDPLAAGGALVLERVGEELVVAGLDVLRGERR